jgi:peptidoglycan/LPS O-acetylase OafA/YrhL
LAESLRLHYSKFDLLVNVLVGLIGGVLVGFWIAAGEVAASTEPSSKRSPFALLRQMLPWVALVGVLAIGVEVAQLFFVNRIPNIYDIVSQITGFLIAMVVVARTGQRLILARGSWFDQVAERGLFLWVGLLASLVYLVTHWWPLIPAITPGEIRLKLRQGLVLGELRGDVWSAIGDQMERHAGSLSVRLIVSSALGWWIGSLLPGRSRIVHFLNAALVAFAIAVITEAGRGLIDQLDVSILGFLFALVGLCLGILPVSLLKKRAAFADAADTSPLAMRYPAILLGMVLAIFYLVSHWWPLIPSLTAGAIKQKWRDGLLLGGLRGGDWSVIRQWMEDHPGSVFLRLVASCCLGWWIGRNFPLRNRGMRFLISSLVCLGLSILTEAGRGLIEGLDVTLAGSLLTLSGLWIGLCAGAWMPIGVRELAEGERESNRGLAPLLRDETGGAGPSASTISRLDWLDGLRAMACSYVFGVHFAQQISFSDESSIWSFRRFLEFGLGVSFFFLLSAGLLSLPWWKGGEVAWNWSRFIRDKMVRILPPYLLLLLALFFLTQQFRTKQGWIDLTSHLLFVHNFQDRTLYGMSPPLWYLACQMQAYLVLPILFLAFLPLAKTRSGKAILCGCLAAVSWVVFYLATIYGSNAIEPIGSWFRTQPVSVMHSLASHLPNLLIGAMAGWIVWRSSAVPWCSTKDGIADVAGLAILGLMVVLAGLPEAWLPWFPKSRYGFPWMPLLMLLLLYLISVGHHLKRCLEWRPWVQLGKISYGFYIYHYSILLACKVVMGYLGLDWKSQWVLLLLVSFPATCLFSYVSYHFLELPIERYCKGKQPAEGKQ